MWDGDIGVDSNVIEVYVGFLRRKLDQLFELESLQTIYGAGYRLVDATGQPAQVTPSGR